MAASESVSESIGAPYPVSVSSEFVSQGIAHRRSPSQAALKASIMMAVDLFGVLLAFVLASVFRFDLSPSEILHPQPWLLVGRDLPIHPGYLLFFVVTLLIVNRRHGLYGPLQGQGALHEQREMVQSCFAAGLLLCGGLYVMRNITVPRGVVAWFITLTTVFLCLLRALWRRSVYRNYERGIDTRNVLIVGASHIGNALRKQLARSGHLGRVFKGFIESPDSDATERSDAFILGSLKQLTSIARTHFIDEIIIAERSSTAAVIDLVGVARQLDIEVLVIPGLYDELTPDAPIEYLGNFPVVALHRRNGRIIGQLLKRIWDVLLSSFFLLALVPTFLIIALLIKIDSPGRVFYISHRIGKKGRVFPCFKFRTMVANADQLKDTLASLNERDGILFKITKDPRLTKIGRVLRKFSLDELPQLFNVLWGDMSLVGPRPPLANEVGRYELEHFRRLEVLPGITGLWQVRARQDPSFERYVALDLAYVENWSFWLDLKILIKTTEVVLRGTGC
jgi:exopolysaccharide biosynthesis polyprenyl glycosylphosphotransferase